MEWDEFRFVLTVKRAGGLAAAARLLTVSTSTAHRKLEDIEKRAGVQLFERSALGYRLTAHGESVARAAEAMELEAISAERQLSGADQKVAGRICVNTNALFGAYVLPELIFRFAKKYPEIMIVAKMNDEIENLGRTDVDIVIRATSAPPSHLVGRKVAPVPYCAYARRDLIELNGKGALVDYDWIGLDDNNPRSAITRWTRDIVPEATCKFTFNSTTTLREAVAEGIGAAVLPCFTGDHISGVSRISPVGLEPDFSLWILTHVDLRRNVRVRTFMRFLDTLLSTSPYMESSRREGKRLGYR
jgi:DNA-binding transcriptional LysR family regulator